MTKVILIEPNKAPTLFDYNDETHKKIFGTAVTDGIALRAPECKDMLLAMIGYDISKDMEYNSLATIFASYLRRYFRYQENKIYGPVIIIDDNGSIDEAKYKILKDMTNEKKKANYKGCNNHLYPKISYETVDYMIEVPDGCDIDFPLPPGTKVGKLEHPLLLGTTKMEFRV